MRGQGSGFRGQGPLLIAALILFSFPARAAVFHPQTYTLANGMQVVVVRNALSPAVAQMVWYKVGATDDPKGKSGLAHYLEHLMFKGTETLPPGAFSAIIARQGGEENAFTSYDETAYHEEIAADRLALVMQMEADRMRRLKIADDPAKTELAVVLNERQQRTDNDPEGQFNEKMAAALFPGQPYGRPVIGWKNEIEKLTPADARAFDRRYYEPNNAVLVVSGNVDPAHVAALASATFGRLASEEKPHRAALPKPGLPAQDSVVLRDSRITQPSWTRRIVAPNEAQNQKEADALEVLSEALSGGEVGALYRHFVIDKRLAAGIDTRFDPMARGPAVFALAATPAPGVGVERMAESVDLYLKKIAAKGLSRRDVEAAKQRMTDAALFARDRLMAPAEILGQALVVGLPLSAVEDWPQRIAAVTSAQVNAALRCLLAEPRRVDGFLLPQEKEGALK